MTNKPPSSQIINQLLNSRASRIEATRQSLLLFFSIYFHKFIKYEIAPFQKEMIDILQDELNKIIVFTAFRNSGKTTISGIVLAIWSIIGIHKKKDVVLVSQTEPKAERLLSNIRRQLEYNKLLHGDHGTFYSGNEEWNKRTLVISPLGARITSLSVGESTRGILHEENRPDLIIYDDIEDVKSAKTLEGRDNLQDLIGSEFMPLGTKNTRHVFIGNIVHNDSMMARLIKSIETGTLKGIFRQYPLVNEDGKIAWPGQFPDMKAIEELRKQQINDEYFQREFLLKPIPEGGRLINPRDIQRYGESELAPRADFRMYLVTIDPAVSGEHASNNDKTGIIVYRVYGYSEKMKIYVSPNPINERIEWPEIIKKVKAIVESFGQHSTYRILVEGGSTQKGLTQMLKFEGLNAEEISPQGNDKRTRLSMLKPWLSNKIVFPHKGTEEIEMQLVGFGSERYDDLVDSLTLLVYAVPEIEKASDVPRMIKVENLRPSPTEHMIEGGGWRRIAQF
jgi:predicted phage terminase large subunit-like protein